MDALEHDTVKLNFKGSAGQSFGAFVPKGVTRYAGRRRKRLRWQGLSGGKIVVHPPENVHFRSIPENIIVGNVALYGATSGEAYIGGMAGERFCVRNSGVHAVVEAVGDHGCEYMTGGRVVVIGPTGRKLCAQACPAARLTCWIWPVIFKTRCNSLGIGLERLDDPAEREEVRQMIERHAKYTGSERAKKVLEQWETMAAKFVKVMPRDYNRMLQEIKAAEATGLNGDEALMAAFEKNAKDVARIGGS